MSDERQLLEKLISDFGILATAIRDFDDHDAIADTFRHRAGRYPYEVVPAIDKSLARLDDQGQR